MIRILGDLILDKWMEGYYKRMSPEAKVKIFDTKSINYKLGGASNVATILTNLNDKIKLYGFIGNDNNGLILNKLLKKNKIKSKVNFTKSITTIKTRLINKVNYKHILRIDSEEKIKNNYSIFNFKKEIKKNDLIVIVDYNKGAIQKNTVKKILNYSKNVFVDPKNKPELYKEAFLVKPNMKQYKKWIGKFTLKKSLKLIELMKWQWLVVTDGSNGVHVINKKGEYEHYKYKANNVIDTVGAGDVFMSSLCHFYNLGMNIFQSSDLACEMSTISVQKKFTYSFNDYEIYNKKIFRLLKGFSSTNLIKKSEFKI